MTTYLERNAAPSTVPASAAITTAERASASRSATTSTAERVSASRSATTSTAPRTSSSHSTTAGTASSPSSTSRRRPAATAAVRSAVHRAQRTSLASISSLPTIPARIPDRVPCRQTRISEARIIPNSGAIHVPQHIVRTPGIPLAAQPRCRFHLAAAAKPGKRSVIQDART
ncbi:hypothetical protein VTI74DRAFT_8963 [Chaetomium olivicolor]